MVDGMFAIEDLKLNLNKKFDTVKKESVKRRNQIIKDQFRSRQDQLKKLKLALQSSNKVQSIENEMILKAIDTPKVCKSTIDSKENSEKKLGEFTFGKPRRNSTEIVLSKINLTEKQSMDQQDENEETFRKELLKELTPIRSQAFIDEKSIHLDFSYDESLDSSIDDGQDEGVPQFS